MASTDQRLLILSDIHYASSAEKTRGLKAAPKNRLAHFLEKAFCHFIWQRDVFAHNHWLDLFIQNAGEPDWVVAVGDYPVAGYLGVSDDACFASARECIEKLRSRFGDRFLPVIGDHDLGKTSLFGASGGLRLASWHRTQDDLALKSFWMRDIGCYRLMGIVSSLVALPVFESETLANELHEWRRLRELHMAAIGEGFETLQPHQKVILFCHDPTAIPFLWREPRVRNHVDQLEQTVIGHLHTNLVFWESRVLAGIPRIGFLGKGIHRITEALHEARLWKTFKMRLCPALSGIELCRNSGFYEVQLDLNGRRPPLFEWRSLKHCR